MLSAAAFAGSNSAINSLNLAVEQGFEVSVVRQVCGVLEAGGAACLRQAMALTLRSSSNSQCDKESG
jgi:hypothetical protein